MRYWWVNHKQTVRQEIKGGYLWSPKRTKDDRRSQFYDNMVEADPGDGVLSFADAQIRYVGRVTEKATEGLKPAEYGPAGENWNNVGWYLPVDWFPLPQPVRPKANIADVRDWLPKKYAPIRATGDGNQGAYLSEIPQELFHFLTALGGGELELWSEPASPVLGKDASDGLSAGARVSESYTPFDAAEGPSIYVYMIAMLDTLRAFGGAATSDQICDWFVDRGIARPLDIATVQKHGETRFRKEVRFARLALAKAGLLQGSERGYWRLSPRGWCTYLNVDEARVIANGRWPAVVEKSLDDTDRGPSPASSRAAQGPSKGPRPVAWEGVVRRLLVTGASTYVMRFGTTSIWKIGYASNVTKRLAELNRHVPVEVLKRRWALAREERWSEPLLAYEMEQRVLRELKGYYTHGERVRCTEGQLDAAWERAKG